MQNLTPKPEYRKLRAIIEIDPAGGEPTIYPICDSDMDRERILDYLRIFAHEHFNPAPGL